MWFNIIMCRDGCSLRLDAGSPPLVRIRAWETRQISYSGVRNPTCSSLRVCAKLTTYLHHRIPMSFQDIEAGLASPTASRSVIPQSQEESAFLGLQSSLSLQVFKINANVQGILKLVDQLGTSRDSAPLRKSL